MKKFFFLATMLFALSCFAQYSSLIPEDLRCEYLKNPSGIDSPKPRLSWILRPSNPAQRSKKQTAFQILVSESIVSLNKDIGDLWDSGRIVSDQSINIYYDGIPLKSAMDCFWKVRVWDDEGKVSKWSSAAKWSMGILNESEWKAKWIGLDESPEESGEFKGTFWVWYPEGEPQNSAPIATRFFRREFSLDSGNKKLIKASFIGTADNIAKIYINGKEIGSMNNFHTAFAFDILPHLVAGKNVIAVSVENSGTQPNPAGLAGILRLEYESGESVIIKTDSEWKCAQKPETNWNQTGFDEKNWQKARVIGEVGMAPWGKVLASEERRLPARYLRKEFNLNKSPLRATVFMSGLGLSELYINGEKIGNAVLSPALTQYDRRVFYVTYDVTENIKKGKNAIGVILGNGRYFAPRLRTPAPTRTFGYPKLLLQMRIEYPDGAVEEICSDQSWKLTTNGPIRANNEYDGEEYDARLEMPGWNKVGFEDSGWVQARIVSPPGGKLAAQMMNPIRVTETLKPIAITTPKPGVYIFDMGQNMVGWCRLKTSGKAGTAVRLRHSEILKPNGELYLDNIRGAKVTDTYILKGRGTEIYEPRFTYHGFRYVEVTGLNSKPSLSTIEGCVVNDDVEPAGEFECSNPLVNRIYRNIVWGVRGNYRSIPTDCPQRDERQGWLGDRSAESKGETYLFNVAALYRKWVQDMEDAQRESGSISDVCPAYWEFYSDNVTWPSSSIIIPQALYEQYADIELIKSHYESAKKWIDYMSGFIGKDGLIARDSYGDWCVPPEDPKLIHSKDPNRRTDRTLLASAYFYYDLTLMADYAKLLGKSSDRERFIKLANSIKDAFNNKFYKKDSGYYDNGTQTSCVLPLAFGLVPEGEANRVFDRLLWKIENESRGHIGTGLIGCQFINRVLTEYGRPDVVYKMVSQNDYPSLGYMVEKGATTIWELWNGDTADPAMNSHNHVMLVGDLVIWFYEYLAGIKPDPQNPGFKHIIMKPHPVQGLSYVKATYRSLHGRISSNWQKQGNTFLWEIEIPPNTSATVFVPVNEKTKITESGVLAEKSASVQYLGRNADRAIFKIGSGLYRFKCD
jgi:alpha-L-rhamnosidase